MHLAALGGHVEVCKLLLEPERSRLPGAADEDAAPASWPDATAVDLWRRSPLHKAAEGGHAAVVRLMLGSARGVGTSCSQKDLSGGRRS